MILSRKHRFAFIKTLKTASTSTEIFLSRYAGSDDVITYLPPPDETIRRGIGAPGPQNCFNPLWKQIYLRLTGVSRNDAAYAFHHNISAAELRDRIPTDWAHLVTFTIVRNPFDRAISKFFNDHKREAIARLRDARPHTREEINTYIRSLPDRELTNWHLYTDADEIIVTDVLRYENLAPDLGRVLAKTGLTETVDLPKAKGSWRLDHRHYSEVIDAGTRKRIEEVAAKEIKAFGYDWERIG